MRKFTAASLFYGLSILLFPISLLGYLIWAGKGVLGVTLKRRPADEAQASATAQGPIMARWFEHELGVRDDEPARRMLAAVPGVPPLGLKLVTEPTLIAHRLTGYVPLTFRYPYEGRIKPEHQASARISFFDTAVRLYLHEQTQFVILGAGFDTRIYRLSADARARSFEVDMPQTQATKCKVLAAAGVDARGVRFVPADFEKEDWFDKLTEAGFDLDVPALFLFEGVTMYLDPAAFEDSLRKIARSAPGSVVAFDYMTREVLESSNPYWRYARAMTQVAGEPFKFGVDSAPPVRERIAEILAACGLSLAEHRTLGAESDKQRAWGGFATARVKAKP